MKTNYSARMQKAIEDARRLATNEKPMYVRQDRARLIVTDQRPHRRCGYILVTPKRTTLCPAIE